MKKDIISSHQATHEIAWPRGFHFSTQELLLDAKAGFIKVTRKHGSKGKVLIDRAEFERYLRERGQIYKQDNDGLSEFVPVKFQCKHCGAQKTHDFLRHAIKCTRMAKQGRLLRQGIKLVKNGDG